MKNRRVTRTVAATASKAKTMTKITAATISTMSMKATAYPTTDRLLQPSLDGR